MSNLNDLSEADPQAEIQRLRSRLSTVNRRIDAALYERDLRRYVDAAWNVIEPATRFVGGRHIDAVCEYLSAVSAGQIRRLIVNQPPRTTKSSLISILWPTWQWAIDKATSRWMFASYSSSLSIKHSVDRRTLITSDWYQGFWPVKLAGDTNLKQEFASTARGTMFATSVGGSTTGKGGQFIVIDDPHSVEQAYSDLERESAIRYLRQTLMTRLNDPRTGAIVLVMQRLHENDATGEFLADGGWEHLCLPAIAESRQVISLPSGKRIIREPGDVLEPERLGLDTLADLKRSMGSFAYAGQMQQQPAPSGGAVFERHWWRYWRPKGIELPDVTVSMPDGSTARITSVELPEITTMAMSFDLAFKDLTTSDPTVGLVIGQKNADYFVLDLVTGRWSFPEMLSQFRNLTAKWPRAHLKLIEEAANGSAAIATLKTEIAGIKGVKPTASKQERAAAVSPLVESGNVYLPHPTLAPWVDGFIDECAAFPRGKHDDQVDAFSQGLQELSTKRMRVYFV